MNLAIVSSYAEECGAAFYSSRLKKHLEEAGHKVDILRLPVSLLRQRRPSYVRTKGNAEVDRIAKEAKRYDAVLMQFEPGLYGSEGITSYDRAWRIASAARKVILTVHGFDRFASDFSTTQTLIDIAKLRVQNVARDYGEAMNRRASMRFWRKVKGAQHISVMTFCKADRTLLDRHFDLPRLDDFPITYFDQSEVNAARARYSRDDVLRRYGLDPAKKYFGVFGFFGRYKGFLTAMKALEHLPDDYHLAIVGGEHPQGLEAERDVGPYLQQMLAFAQYEPPQDVPIAGVDVAKSVIASAAGARRDMLIDEVVEKSDLRYFLPTKPLKDRIHFLGQVADEEMPPLYVAMDYVVMPYIKTRSGQSGSGPATFAIEFGTKAIFSSAPVFREIGRYFEGSLHHFNVGNFVELAEAIQRYDNFASDIARNREKALARFNPKSMVAKYEEMLGLAPRNLGDEQHGQSKELGNGRVRDDRLASNGAAHGAR